LRALDRPAEVWGDEAEAALQRVHRELSALAEDLDRRTGQARERGDGMRAMDWGYAARKVRAIRAALDQPEETP
jgi:hypothetical protein